MADNVIQHGWESLTQEQRKAAFFLRRFRVPRTFVEEKAKDDMKNLGLMQRQRLVRLEVSAGPAAGGKRGVYVTLTEEGQRIAQTKEPRP